jgi:predicted transposase/invertase (TIGR01784 family)
MKLLPLTNDFVFKAVFAKNEDLLLDLLNSFPEFVGEHKIKNLKVLNPEISMDMKDDKLSILDIRAEDVSKNIFLIEMQASRQADFPKRVLYYWSKLYSRSLKKGRKYSSLPKVYSFNFINFNLIKDSKKYHSVFHILEKTNPEISLTEDLEIHMIELPKFKALLPALKDTMETWIFALKEIQNLQEEQMKILEKRNPKVKKAVSELKFVSHDKKSRAYYEARLKADLDYNSNIDFAFNKGLSEGIEKGIEKGKVEGSRESLLLGIQLGLELKFNSDGLKLVSEIKKIADIAILQKILSGIKQAKSITEIRKIYNKK